MKPHDGPRPRTRRLCWVVLTAAALAAQACRADPPSAAAAPAAAASATPAPAAAAACPPPPSRRAAIDQITATWNEFVAQLAAGRPEMALVFVSAASQPRVAKALFAADSDPQGFAARMRDLQVRDVRACAARADVFAENDEGDEQAYPVQFGRRADGSWEIVSF